MDKDGIHELSLTSSSENDSDESDMDLGHNCSSSSDEHGHTNVKRKKRKRRRRKDNKTEFYVKKTYKRRGETTTTVEKKKADVCEEKDSEEDVVLEDIDSDTSDEETSLAEALKFLRTEDLECASDVKKVIKKRSRYQEQLDDGDATFNANKGGIVQSFLEAQFARKAKLCVFCDCSSSIFCSVCGSLCSKCDVEKHCVKPLHNRFYAGQNLPPGVTVLVGNEEFLQYDLLTPLSDDIVKTCDNCSVIMDVCATSSLHTVVDLENSCVCKQPTFKCKNCEQIQSPTLSDYIKSGLFPLNGDIRSSTVATISVLEFWYHLKNIATKCGLASFIATLTRIGFATLNQQTFDKLYCQYNHIKYTVDTELYEDTPFQCPAINSLTHRPHNDGDAKLINFTATHQTSSKGQQYYGDAFIGDDDELMDNINKFKKHGFVSKSDNHCGTSHWKAGSNSQSKSPALDAKGLQVSGCEHYMYLFAYNQPLGELFCLNGLLIKKLQELGYHFSQIELDISCLFTKWYQRLKLCTKLLEELGFQWKDIEALIGDFHSQGHSLFCRIIFGCLWSGHGRPSGGEMMEVLNAPLSLLRDKTRFMKLQRRNDEISEKVAYDNTNRSECIVPTLVKKREKMKSELDLMSEELLVLEGKINQEITLKDIADVKGAAMTVVKKEFSELEENIEFLVFSFMYKKRQLKTSADNKMIAKLRLNLASVKSNLCKAIGDYNERNDEKLNVEDIQNGIFPWQQKFFKENYRNENPMEFLKACELFLKKENTVIEIDIIEQDVKCIIEKRLEHIKNLDVKSQGETALHKIALKNKINSLIQRLLRDKSCISKVPDLKYMENLVAFDCKLFPCEMPKIDTADLIIENTNLPLDDID